MCDARLFAPQVEALSAGRTVICADLTGSDSIRGMADQVLSAAPPSFALAGLSMGGIVAMEMIGLSPERIKGVCLMDTNPLAETETVRAARAPQLAKAQAGDLRAVMRDEMKPRYLADGPRRQDVLDLCMDMAMSLGPEVFRDQSHALMDRSDQTDVLKEVDVPALILCGAEDRLCPVSRHELMASLIPDAQLEVIRGAGHLPVLETPDITTEKLENWLGLI